MAETLLWIFLLAGWLALTFALGCLMEEIRKKLRPAQKREPTERGEQIAREQTIA